MPETAPPPPDLTGLSLGEIAALVEAKRLPPVENWHPAHCGDSRMRIDAEGGWHHDGAPIARPAMVRLFASILRREPDGGYVLVNPAEKLSIVVEDTPFVAVELTSEGAGLKRRLAFRLNTGELVIAGAAHPLRIAHGSGSPRPHLLVRTGLEARLARPVYYELAALALDEGGDPPGIWSDSVFFALDEA